MTCSDSRNFFHLKAYSPLLTKFKQVLTPAEHGEWSERSSNAVTSKPSTSCCVIIFNLFVGQLCPLHAYQKFARLESQVRSVVKSADCSCKELWFSFQAPEPTRLIPTSNSSPQGFSAFFWPPQVLHVVHTHT